MSRVGNWMGAVLFLKLGLIRRGLGLENQNDEFSFRHVEIEDTARHLKGRFPVGNWIPVFIAPKS